MFAASLPPALPSPLPCPWSFRDLLGEFMLTSVSTEMRAAREGAWHTVVAQEA